MWECAVFVLFVGVSTLAPLWGVTGSGKRDDGRRGFVLAGGVSTAAMVLSITRGTLGVRSFLGFPSELVYYGAAMWETVYGTVLALPLVAVILVPVFMTHRTLSVYGYLEARLGGAAARRVAAAAFLWRQLLHLAVTASAPATALHAALGVPPLWSAVVLGALAAFASAAGGLKAAIRADVQQTLVMLLLSAAILFRALYDAGGPVVAVRRAAEGGRLDFFNFTWDPRTRVDTSSALFGQLFASLSVYGCQQTFVQRYCSMPRQRDTRRALLVAAPVLAATFSLSWLVGIALYAASYDCDPLASGQTAHMDEALPYFVATRMSFPGVSGLFLGALFTGALGILVSNANSLATVTWEDFLSAIPSWRATDEGRQLAAVRWLAAAYSMLIAALSLPAARVGGVIEVSQLVTSATAGPLLGGFLLAALVPGATDTGVAIGMLSAHALTTWMAAGHLVHGGTRHDTLPLRTDGCDGNTTSAQYVAAHDAFGPWPYAVSYMWYAVLGTAVCMAVGSAVSAVTRGRPYDSRLLHPLCLRLSRKAPGKKRQYTDDTHPPITTIPPPEAAV